MNEKRMVIWVINKVSHTIETLPQKDFVLLWEDLRNKSPDEFLETKNYRIFLEINCKYYFDEKKLVYREIDKNLLVKIVKKLKEKYKDPVR